MKKVGKTKEKSRAWWKSLSVYQQADYLYRRKLRRGVKADWNHEFERAIRMNNYAGDPSDKAVAYYEQIYCRDGADIDSPAYQRKRRPAGPDKPLELGKNPKLVMTKELKQVLREVEKGEEKTRLRANDFIRPQLGKKTGEDGPRMLIKKGAECIA